jgi:hypothetical protein
MKKALFSFAVLALVATATQAQPGDQGTTTTTTTAGGTTFGIKAGVGFQNFYGKDAAGKRINTEMGIKWNAGVNVEIPVATDFYVQPGLTIGTKGAKQDASGSGATAQPEMRWNLYYLDIPVNLLYKPTLGANRLLLGFGPYVGFGIGGKVITDRNTGGDLEQDVEYRSEVTAADLTSGKAFFKRMDAGANVLVGIELANRMSIAVNSQIGLSNIAPDYPTIGGQQSQTKLSNIGFGLSLGYRFGK